MPLHHSRKEVSSFTQRGMPNVRSNPHITVRAVSAAISGCALGAVISLPVWVQARTLRPPRAVLREVFECGAVTAASDVIEDSIERARGYKGDLVAPVVGTVVPRVASVTIFTILSHRRFIRDVREGRAAQQKASMTREESAKYDAEREREALNEWYPSEPFRWRSYAKAMLGNIAFPLLNIISLRFIANTIASNSQSKPKLLSR